MKRILLLSLFLIFANILKAQTYIEMYNNTNKEMYAAVAYWDNQNGCWTSKGWYKIEKYNTASVELGNYGGKVYIHGKQNTLLEEKTWGSGYYFCVDPNDAFEIRFADQANCRRKRQFSEMNVGLGVNKWTFNP